MGKRRLDLIVHDVRSAHNVGSILRSADGLGVEKTYFTGYTPYPSHDADERLPHEAKRVTSQIAKTALGAEKTARWRHEADVSKLISKLKSEGFLVAALEQTAEAVSLPEFKPKGDIALIVGSEVGGLRPALLKQTEFQLAIPMLGSKESFNVSVAAALALYHLRWYNWKPNDR